MLRESKNNSCLNPLCLQTECCLLEANNTIQLYRQQIDELYLQLLDKEGLLTEYREKYEVTKKKLLKFSSKETKNQETQSYFEKKDSYRESNNGLMFTQN